MNCIDSIIRRYIRDASQPGRIAFKFVFRVIYEVTNSHQAAIAEHILSDLALSYHPFGGFNAVTGGDRVEFAHKVIGEIYDEYTKLVQKQPWYLSQIDTERKKLETEWQEMDQVLEGRRRQFDYEQARELNKAGNQELIKSQGELEQYYLGREALLTLFVDLVEKNIASLEEATELNERGGRLLSKMQELKAATERVTID